MPRVPLWSIGVSYSHNEIREKFVERQADKCCIYKKKTGKKSSVKEGLFHAAAGAILFIFDAPSPLLLIMVPLP